MRIYHNQLAQHCQQQISPVWLIFGDEPWQKIDSLKQLKFAASNMGFSEVVRLSADDSFDWNTLIEEFQSLSLFASQRIIELELPTGKVGTEGAKVLQSISGSLTPDILFILHGPKVDAATTKKKWFSALEKQGIYLPLYDIEGQHLSRWLQQQAKLLQLNLAHDVFPFLSEFFEGNLPALAQELEKLSLLYGKQPISFSDVENLVIKQAKFNPFQLIDVILTGDIQKAIKMLDSLQQEGTAIGQLIWILHKELNQLSSIKSGLNQGQAINDLFKQFRIWDKRKPLYQKALNNISDQSLAIATSRLADVDLLSKSASDFNPFLLLADVCVSLYHSEATRPLSLAYEH